MIDHIGIEYAARVSSSPFPKSAVSQIKVIYAIFQAKNHTFAIIQGGPERSRQSNLAVFTVEGGLDLKFPYLK